MHQLRGFLASIRRKLTHQLAESDAVQSQPTPISQQHRELPGPCFGRFDIFEHIAQSKSLAFGEICQRLSVRGQLVFPGLSPHDDVWVVRIHVASEHTTV